MTHARPALARQLRAALSEPLVHFLALGALVFLACGGNSPGSSGRLAVSSTQIARISADYAATWQHPPDSATLAVLVEQFIREEVLARQAVALGLDREDPVIRRRLAQQMEMFAASGVPDPDDTDIATYYRQHRADYATAPGLTFSQRFFDPRLRGASAGRDAAQALARLRAGQPVRSDPLLLPETVADRPAQSLARDFGGQFAAQLARVPPGQWAGPLISPYGLHLVRVSPPRAAAAPPLAEVFDRVRRDLINARSQAARDAEYQRLRRHYQVSVAGAGA